MRAPGSLHDAGLEEVQGQTFAADFCAPLGSGEKTALTSLFDMLWGTHQPEVLVEDWQAYQRLCSPGSPDFILNLSEYYGFFTYTVFRGRVPKTKRSIEGHAS